MKYTREIENLIIFFTCFLIGSGVVYWFFVFVAFLNFFLHGEMGVGCG